MKIGLLSDTHGYLDEKILEHFAACDEVWHAGDIGDAEITDRLEKFKPLRAVYGNIDDRKIQERFGENLQFECDGLRVLITHIAGTPPRYNPRVKKLLTEIKPGLLICGHSHVLQVKKDPDREMLFINPGAAGNQGFHHVRTAIRMDILNGKVGKLEVIELGKRGVLDDAST